MKIISGLENVRIIGLHDSSSEPQEAIHNTFEGIEYLTKYTDDYGLAIQSGIKTMPVCIPWHRIETYIWLLRVGMDR